MLICRWFIAALLGWATTPLVQAHLVMTQRGTLNIVENSAYMVLSLPVSAFSGIDDDHDGLLSINELRTHASSIVAQIQEGVALYSDLGPSSLEGVVLNTAPPDSSPSAPSSHLVVLGRFPIQGNTTELNFSFRLFGTHVGEKIERITVTRGMESQLLTLTPADPMKAVFPSHLTNFLEQVQLGAVHILSGADHLLFLLAVLATAWNLRQIVLALTCFTLGHAISMIACVWFGLTVPSYLVEPAIAATIIGMALFDRWSENWNVSRLILFRMTLVFLCALIHGLGLAGAFSDLGVEGWGKVISLVGFNTGIELVQIAIAFTAALAMQGVQKIRGAAGIEKTTHIASYLAVALGTAWLFQRALA